VSIRNGFHHISLIVLVIVILLLILSVSAGSNVVTSPMGKLIVTPWKSARTQTYCGNLPDNLVSTSSASHQTVGIASSSPDYDIQPDYNTASKCIDTGSQFPGGLIIAHDTGLAPLSPTNFSQPDPGLQISITNPAAFYPETQSADGLINMFRMKDFPSSFF
jgi:hypothetical protein